MAKTHDASSAGKRGLKASLSYNESQNGIELRFDGELTEEELKAKLRVFGFRPSKVKNMWYAQYSEEAKGFAEKLVQYLPTVPVGPPVNISASFDPIKPNVEKKEFSFVNISLKDGLSKSYILFEPSKPKAEVIAFEFARKEFGNQFLGLVVKPRTNLREARLLFEEGKIMFPRSEGKSLPLEELKKFNPYLSVRNFYSWLKEQHPGLSQSDAEVKTLLKAWLQKNYSSLTPDQVEAAFKEHERSVKIQLRSEKHLDVSAEEKTKIEPYSTILKRLLKVIPNLIENIENGAISGKSKLASEGLMDLNFDYLGKDKDGNYIIALSHYYEQEGDLIADPDMEIRINPDSATAEAMTYQDTYKYQEVYPEVDGRQLVNLRLKKALNDFLKQWLNNLIEQGHRIDLSAGNERDSKADQSEEKNNEEEQDGAPKTTDPLANEHGVYTEETAGENFETVEIKFPKSTKLSVKVFIVKTAQGDYRNGINLRNESAGFSGMTSPASVDGDAFESRKAALKNALLYVQDKIEPAPSQWQKGKALEWKQLVDDTIKKFALREGINLDLGEDLPSQKSDVTKISTATQEHPDPLQEARWSHADDEYPVNKATVVGVDFHQGRLRQVLLDKFSKLSANEQSEIVEKLKSRVSERRPLDNYLMSNAIRNEKSKEKKKIAAMQLFVDDIIIDNDLSKDGSYPAMTFLFQILYPDQATNSHYQHREPWMMRQREFIEYVKDYLKRFKTYPAEVQEMFDVLVRLFPEGHDLLSQNHTADTIEKVAKGSHLLHIYKAVAKGRDLSEERIAQDYPWLRSKLASFSKSGDLLAYGFDATDFKTSESFAALLQSVNIDSKYKVCSYLNNYPNAAPPVYLWEGMEIRMVTANNPLLKNGYASFIGIEGVSAQVTKAVQFIEQNTVSKGEAGLNYIGFEYLFCIDPEWLDGIKEILPSKPSGETKREVSSERSTNAVSTSVPETVYPKPKHRFSEVQEVPRSSITVRPEIFQGRETDYAQETVDKIVREGFDKTQEPIIVWMAEDGKLVVISGHSRWEASRRLYEAGDKSLVTMPVKVYQGTLAEAMDYALLESNRGITQEGLKSDLRAFKFAKQKGYNREYLQGIFKPESRLKLLEDISSLSENGSFLTYIDTEAEKSFPYLQRNAHWVGQIRKQHPELTSSHEEEMFRYLYGLSDTAGSSARKKLLVTKGQFFDLLEKKVSRIDFDSLKPLNLEQVVSTSALTDPAKERIKEIDKDIDKLEQERNQKDELIVRAMKEGKESLIEKFKERQEEINQVITRKILEKQKIEKEIGILERTSFDLFTSIDPGPTDHAESKKTMEETELGSPRSYEDYIDRIVAIMHERYANSERATKKEIDNLGNELGISSKGKVWEAVELSWLLWYHSINKEPGSFASRLSKMIRFWNNVQPTYAYSDSSKEIYKQYSTPCLIGAIVGQYTGMDDKTKAVFDPSAGNGNLVMAARPLNTYVNEVDATRLDSLKYQGFKSITQHNAAKPFPDEFTEAFDIVVTNPPFARWEDEQFDKDFLVQKIFDHHVGLNHTLRLEHVMAGIALRCMKDSGKAAIIIMNHIQFDDKGFVARYRPFFNWLYRHYNVDDIINLNGFKLYNKQGTIEKTMLILIDGRKKVPAGVAPRKEQAPHLDEMVDSFEDLWKRVQRHLYLKIYSGVEVLNSILVKNQSAQLDMERDIVRATKYYKLPISISELRRNDSYMHTMINERLRELQPGKKISGPVVIGTVRRPNPSPGVLSGSMSVVQALANGYPYIEAYVPIDSREYITRHHSGYTIEKVIQQLILAIAS